jgi:hypothetical protein
VWASKGEPRLRVVCWLLTFKYFISLSRSLDASSGLLLLSFSFVHIPSSLEPRLVIYVDSLHCFHLLALFEPWSLSEPRLSVFTTLLGRNGRGSCSSTLAAAFVDPRLVSCLL